MRNQPVKSLILLVGMSALVNQASAAGFQTTTHSAAGIGRANAGEAVLGDNASVLGRNPAAMLLFEKPSLSVGLNVVVPDTTVTDVDVNGISAPDESGVTSTQPVPNIYYIHPLNERVALGVAAFSNFATGTEFSDEFNEVAGLVAGETRVTTVNMNGSVAVRVVDGFSLGFGLNAIYGSGVFKRPFDPFGTGVDLGLSFEGDGWTFGWDVGAMYEISEKHRLGLAYRSGQEFTAEGDGEIALTTFDEVKLNLPAMAEFSGFHQVAEKWAIHYSAQWTGWSAFDSIEFVGTPVSAEYNWKDSGRYAVGTTYTISSKWTWRAGLAFDQTPVPEENRKMSIPDSNRLWYSTGATFAFSEKSSLDMGLTYLNGDQLEVSEPAPLTGATVNSKTETDAIIIGVNYNRRF